MTPHEVTSQWWDHATLWCADDPHLEDAGHTTNGGRVFGITRLRYKECEDYGCRPVVVISPEDRGAVKRLLSSYLSIYDGMESVAQKGEIDSMQAALREFANPKPPRPDEPQGLGAVVEDADGERWVRSHPGNDPWTRPHLSGVYAYGQIDVVRVLSEGVHS